MEVERCPHCKADLQGPEIPAEYIEQGMYPSGVTHYSRKIGVSVRGHYDVVLFWRCPECNGEWHRWPEGDPRHAAAKEFMLRP